MNDLVERYLKAIKHLLPSGQQEDIVAELRDLIQTRIEEKEAELGRPLKPEEVEAILKSLGAPAAVAARYGANRYLIGPTVFPVYWLALRTLLAIVLFAELAGAVIRTAVGLARGEPTSLAQSLGQAFGDLWASAFFIVGFVTVVAAVVERVRPDLLEGEWLVDRLSQASEKLDETLRKDVVDKARRKAARRRSTPTQTRVEGAFGMVINLAAFVWLAGFVAAPETYPDYLSPEHWIETTGLAFTPIWREQLFYLILAGMAARMVLHFVMLLWPTSQRRFAAAKLISNAAAIGFAYVAVQADALFAPAPGMADPKVQEVLRGVNLSLHIAFIFVLALTALDCLYRVWRLVGPRGSGCGGRR